MHTRPPTPTPTPTLCAGCGRAISATAVRCRRCAGAERGRSPLLALPDPHAGPPTAEDAARIRAARIARMADLDPRAVVAILRKTARL
jgi:hypothetical protein